MNEIKAVYLLIKLLLLSSIDYIDLMECEVGMKVVICDNNMQDLEKYQEIFQSIAINNNIKAEFARYTKCEEMFFHIENKDFMDILIIEIEMPGMSGVEAADKLRREGYKGIIIFLTYVQDKKSIFSGYDVGAFHYIVKEETPIDKMEEIFVHAQKEAEIKEQKYILFTAGNEWINIPVNSIRYFEMYKRIVTVYYDDDKFEFHSYSFDNLIKQLHGAEFIRTHRSYLVALKEIKNLTYYTLTTRDGQILPVGRTYYPNIKKALTEYEQLHAVI